MFSLQATTRQEKDNLKSLRQNGLIPAVLYGEGLQSLNLSIAEKPFLAIFEKVGETSTLELNVSGKNYQVLIHQISRDPVSEKIIHLDFFHPSLKKKITVEVPLVFKGEASAVKELGGVVEKELIYLTIKGLVKDMPHKIEVDISSLKAFGDKIVIGDLNIPNKVEVQHHNKEDIVVHLAQPRKEPEPKEEKPKEEIAQGAEETTVKKEEGDKKEEKKPKK